MARNKIKITPENSAEWLASCGFLFPGNEQELERFNKLFGEIDPSITGKEVDPFKILSGNEEIERPKLIVKKLNVPYDQYQMVARKLNDLPQHIIEKIKKNQETNRNNADGAETKND